MIITLTRIMKLSKSGDFVVICSQVMDSDGNKSLQNSLIKVKHLDDFIESLQNLRKEEEK